MDLKLQRTLMWTPIKIGETGFGWKIEIVHDSTSRRGKLNNFEGNGKSPLPGICFPVENKNEFILCFGTQLDARVPKLFIIGLSPLQTPISIDPQIGHTDRRRVYASLRFAASLRVLCVEGSIGK